MKKYFCKTCRKFKSIFDIKFEPYCNPQYKIPICKYCHNKNVVKSEEIIEELYNKNKGE